MPFSAGFGGGLNGGYRSEFGAEFSSEAGSLGEFEGPFSEVEEMEGNGVEIYADRDRKNGQQESYGRYRSHIGMPVRGFAIIYSNFRNRNRKV